MYKLLSTLALVCFTMIAFAQKDANGITVGEVAPMIKGKTTNLGKFNSKKALKDGPVIVVFYRGEWCGYCNAQLKAYSDSLQLLVAKGATVIAVSPETEENVEKTIEKSDTKFGIISDKDNKIAKAFKVNYAVPQATIEKYIGYGIEFDKANGTNGANLPIPATYIIGKDGKVKYVYLNKDISKRVSVATLLEQL
jgi:peroxiredoxin